MAKIHLSQNLKAIYSEIIPVLSGQGNKSMLTLMGRRRDQPSKLDPILSQPWEQGESITIVWEDGGDRSPD